MSEKNVWIVEYDIPVEPASKRRAFYRAVHRELDAKKIRWKWTGRSVIVTPNKDLAQIIHNLAKQYGKSHLYKATKV